MFAYILYFYNTYIKSLWTSNLSTFECECEYKDYNDIKLLEKKNKIQIVQNFPRLNKCLIKIYGNTNISTIFDNNSITIIKIPKYSILS